MELSSFELLPPEPSSDVVVAVLDDPWPVLRLAADCVVLGEPPLALAELPDAEEVAPLVVPF